MAKSPLFWTDYESNRSSRQKTRRSGTRWMWVWKFVAALVAATIVVPLALRWIPPPTSSFMIQSWITKAGVRYQWVSHQRISRHLPVAVVAAEDQKFPQHWGFDLGAISSALEENKRRNRPRGASTITQQVAKNLFLWPGRSYLRKGLEAYFTVMLELLWPKRRILEVYLNIAQFGPGIYGVEAASQHYFHKPAVRLRKEEASLLASVLPNPVKLKVTRPSNYVRQRAGHIRAQMEQLGGVTYLQEIWPKE